MIVMPCTNSHLVQSLKVVLSASHKTSQVYKSTNAHKSATLQAINTWAKRTQMINNRTTIDSSSLIFEISGVMSNAEAVRRARNSEATYCGYSQRRLIPRLMTKATVFRAKSFVMIIFMGVISYRQQTRTLRYLLFTKPCFCSPIKKLFKLALGLIILETASISHLPSLAFRTPLPSPQLPFYFTASLLYPLNAVLIRK
jgi:hypothetical protein